MTFYSHHCVNDAFNADIYADASHDDTNFNATNCLCDAADYLWDTCDENPLCDCDVPSVDRFIFGAADCPQRTDEGIDSPGQCSGAGDYISVSDSPHVCDDDIAIVDSSPEADDSIHAVDCPHGADACILAVDHPRNADDSKTTAECPYDADDSTHADELSDGTNDATPAADHSPHTENNSDAEIFQDLHNYRLKHNRQLIFGHLNVNSMKNKFHEIYEILNNGYIDILGISETKLDESFSNSIFKIQDFTCHRLDRNIHGGGIMMYVRSSVPHRIRRDLCTMSQVEIIVLEVTLRREKMIYMLVYKPPRTQNDIFINNVSAILDKCLSECKTVYIIGDVNINFLNLPDNVRNFMNIYNLTNLVCEPTCFKSVNNPSLIDVILTNTPYRIASHLNTCVGISDFHNLVCAATKMFAPKDYKRKIIYRSYKKFDNDTFVSDLSYVPFDICNIFDNVDDVMWAYNLLLNDIVNLHAPVKSRILRKPQIPYMNGELRKAINVKAMLRRKFNRCKCIHTWSLYKKQRNHVTSLKRKSLTQYFNVRCNSNVNTKQFWNTVKPFFSNKNCSSNDVTLIEENKLVTNVNDVCNIFNDYFVNIAEDHSESSNILGKSIDCIFDYYKDHSSLSRIRSLSNRNDFIFCEVTIENVMNKIKKLKVNKSCGYDVMPASILKAGSKVLCSSFTNIINRCLKDCIFPDMFKHAEVTPLYKKNNNLDKQNYRPVSVLSAMSKVLEGLMCDQIMYYFENVLSQSISAYRKLYSTNNVILKCLEDWRLALDDKNVIGCVAMDLSRAFDSIPHGLLIAKLNAYCATEETCKLIHSYLSCRKQRVKINGYHSDWSYIIRGVPQGSILGPVLFNIYLNDLIVALEQECAIYNYADDNTLSCVNRDSNIVKSTLEKACNTAVSWFNSNYMKVNPEKFQFMLLHSDNIFSLDVTDIKIDPVDTIKLLGIYIDKNLCFTEHVNQLVSKGAKQINVLGRLSHKLSESCKQKILDAFIVSNFNYCSLTYHYCKMTDACKLERLFKRALRYVYLDFNSSYSDLLVKANKIPLYVQRIRLIHEAVYKIINNKYPPICPTFYERSNISNMYNLRNTNLHCTGTT